MAFAAIPEMYKLAQVHRTESPTSCQHSAFDISECLDSVEHLYIIHTLPRRQRGGPPGKSADSDFCVKSNENSPLSDHMLLFSRLRHMRRGR